MSNKASALKNFTKEDDGKWKCIRGTLIKQKKGTRLYNHFKIHPELLKKGADDQAELNFPVAKQSFNFTSTVENIFGLIEWICLTMKLFSFVDDSLTKRYCSLKPISTKTLKKYMQRMT